MNRPLRPRGRHRRPFAQAVALLVAGLLLAACGATGPPPGTDGGTGVDEALLDVEAEAGPEDPPAGGGASSDAAPRLDDGSTSVVTAAATRPGDPVRVVIESIDVDAPLVRLGLDDNRHMEVPDFGLAGWYVEGPRPGEPGPSVIAAHVDSRSGPDVFHRLHELRPGAEVRVVYGDGEEVVFVVDAGPVQTAKDELPGDDIWPVTNERRLTLITCGGAFDRSTGHYEDNIIVYTELAGEGHDGARRSADPSP